MEIISSLFLFLISTIFISLSGVMMPGPVFAVTVAKGHKNKKAGALIALGHGIIEFPLMFLIYFGFSKFFTLDIVKIVIGLFGGLMLVFMGIKMFETRTKLYSKEKDLPYDSLIAGIITTANPSFFLWWATIGAALIINASIFGVIGFLLFAIIHWLCDFVWSLSVSIITFKSRHLWNKKIYEIVFGTCAIILILFGVWFILSLV